MKKLTQSDLSRPDVTLTIPVDKFSLLPASLQSTLRQYIDRGDDTQFIYIVPAYVADEFERAAKALQ